MRLVRQGFPEWLSKLHPDTNNLIEKTMECKSARHNNIGNDEYKATLSHEDFKAIARIYEEFLTV